MKDLEKLDFNIFLIGFMGVGKSTVSRFFNNGYVSQEAREKIQKVIEENSYAPNAFARGIKAKNINLLE